MRIRIIIKQKQKNKETGMLSMYFHAASAHFAESHEVQFLSRYPRNFDESTQDLLLGYLACESIIHC